MAVGAVAVLLLVAVVAAVVEAALECPNPLVTNPSSSTVRSKKGSFVVFCCTLGVLALLLLLLLAKLAAEGETNGSLLFALTVFAAGFFSSVGKPKLSKVVGVNPLLVALEGVSGGGVSSRSTGVSVRRGSGRPL